MPDGTDSRAGWIFWLVGAFIATELVFLLVKLVVILLFYFVRVGGLIPDWAYTAAEAFLQGALLAAALVAMSAFATLRMLMPRVAWIAVALTPLLSEVAIIREALTGNHASLFYAVTLPAAVAVAWMLDQRRRLPQQALPADGVGSE
jgi:hypothetical protein